MKYTLLFLALTGITMMLSCSQVSKTPETSTPKTSANKPSQQKVVEIDSNNWKGDWERTDWQAGASLIIKSFKGNRFHFEIEAVNGGNSGEIGGEGVLQGDSAISEETDGCRLALKLSVDRKKIKLSATSGCSQFAGNGVYFDGDYEKNGKLKKESLVSLNVLNRQQDRQLKTLVDTFYNRYVECTDIVDTEDLKDIDSLNTAVITSGVKGLFTFMQYIIMTDKKSHIWTAVIDNETVHYFTNSDLFKDHLPKTIDIWREDFKNDPIIYHNK
jgi:hypothetical protein